jgi:flagellar motor switch protein FliM
MANKRSKRTTEMLPVLYTQEEMDEKRDRLSTAMLQYDAVEEEKKVAASKYVEDMKALRGEMRQLSKAIHRKGEDRSTDCIVKFHDPSLGFKTIVRLDTGEVIRTEAMSDDERQDNLFEEVDELERMHAAPDMREVPPPPPESEDQGEDAEA